MDSDDIRGCIYCSLVFKTMLEAENFARADISLPLSTKVKSRRAALCHKDFNRQNRRSSMGDKNGKFDYYTAPRIVDGNETNIYDLWEKGGAYGDSITPSTYDCRYRTHIVDKILAVTSSGDSILSIGCGNGFVEADLLRNSRNVKGIDYNSEAVALTMSKGVPATTKDFYALCEEDVAGCHVIYADGFLGHIFDEKNGGASFFDHLLGLNLAKGTWLIISNDSPRNGCRYEKHQGVNGFWFLSVEYLRELVENANLFYAEGYYYQYIRPQSGPRNRSICLSRVA